MGQKGQKTLINERDIRISRFFYRAGEEACTERSVTSGRARGLTRTTGLPGLEDWKVSGPWGSSHKDLVSQGKQGNESGEAVSEP